jgi:hypothetical protein
VTGRFGVQSSAKEGILDRTLCDAVIDCDLGSVATVAGDAFMREQLCDLLHSAVNRAR